MAAHLRRPVPLMKQRSLTYMSNTRTIWFTGLSRSGKTTLAESLATCLRSRGMRVEILDGKIIRDEMGDCFGYSKEERMKVNRLLCLMARHLARHDIIPIVTAITPYQESRDFNRRELSPYIEIFADCPVEVCLTRDEQGLYKRAIRGDLKHFIGVDDPFEIPRNPDLRVSTANASIEDSALKVNAFITAALAIAPAS
jgi:adenylylsulfate kinase